MSAITSNIHSACARGGTATAELDAWLAKYEPVERDILLSRERRIENAARKRENRRRQFGDLCEASEGLAVCWFRDGASATEMLKYADGDVLLLRALLPFLRQAASERINAVRRQLTRPLYYERENERRRELAAERRRIRRRTTENACPTREEVLDAWLHVRDGRDEMLRFGSILEDLECYVDNQLRFVDGTLVGRGAGIKGWLRENIPALALKYTTVMKYKAAAKKLRQIVELRDPIPLAAVLDTPKNEVRDYNAEKLNSHVDGNREVTILKARAIFIEVFEANIRKSVDSYAMASGKAAVGDVKTSGKAAIGDVKDRGRDAIDDAKDRRRGAIDDAKDRGEGAVGVRDAVRISVNGLEQVAVREECTVTGVLARIDALLDPQKIEETTMLSHWRERYGREITLRTKNKWREILFRRVC